jgi:hypothetical protein
MSKDCEMPKLNYEPLHAFAEKHRVPYNELCVAVRAAQPAPVPVPVPLTEGAVDPDCNYMAPMNRVCNKCGRIHRRLPGEAMTTITLPPLPEPYYDTWPLTPDALRARDLEVARLVLEGAAQHCYKFNIQGQYSLVGARLGNDLMNIEVKHHE